VRGLQGVRLQGVLVHQLVALVPAHTAHNFAPLQGGLVQLQTLDTNTHTHTHTHTQEKFNPQQGRQLRTSSWCVTHALCRLDDISRGLHAVDDLERRTPRQVQQTSLTGKREHFRM